jgi:hypothetical protein
MAREERKTAVDHWGRFQLGSDQITDVAPAASIDGAEATTES